jgi:tetraacyldisaccharide 4'-kinase
MIFAGKIEDAWYRGAWWLWFFLPLEWLFRAVIQLRRALYIHDYLPRYQSPVPLIVVGNVTLGGTGKTPAVIALAGDLTARNLKVGIVSRGAGRRRHDVHLVNEASTVADCGDEALLLFERTGCPCAVAGERPLAVQELTARYDLDVVLSDDGLQHYKMKRDMEIVLYDVQSAFGNGRCLPVGPLREPLSRLGQVDYVLGKTALSGSTQGKEDTAYSASLTVVPSALVNVVTGEETAFSPESLGQHVFAMSGIGRAGQFHQMLEDVGFKLKTRVFPDHHGFVQSHLDELQDLPIIMTEKDAVKCRGLVHKSMWYLKVDAKLPAGVVAGALALLRANA